MDNKKKQTNYKIMIAGPAECGKSQIFNRLVNEEFSQDYKKSLSVNFKYRMVE